MTEHLGQLTGTRAEGTIQISEAALNEVVSLASPGPTVPTIQLMNDNRLEVRYGIVHARAQLPLALDAGPSPRLTVTLASIVVAWTLRAMLPSAFVEFHGRRVTVHLAAMPALAPYRAWWPHVRSARLATAPGVLRVGVTIAIDQGASHG
jgi:hypothetical protein